MQCVHVYWVTMLKECFLVEVMVKEIWRLLLCVAAQNAQATTKVRESKSGKRTGLRCANVWKLRRIQHKQGISRQPEERLCLVN